MGNTDNNPKAFDPEAFKALYAGRTSAIDKLASSLADLHGLICQALETNEKKLAAWHSILDPFSSFGVDASNEPTSREVLVEIQQTREKLAKMGGPPLGQGLAALDIQLERAGTAPPERLATSGSAIDVCLAGVPLALRPSWRSYLDQIGLFIASRPEGKISPPSARPPRL